MIGSSKPLLEIKLSPARIADSNCTVPITGETGTGKELAAEFVHAQQRAAIPDTLVENELFGPSRGLSDNHRT